ncbi:MAG: oligosaccharide flippase family protein [Bacteroidales bacterium]
MHRKFLTNLGLLLFLNILIKPFWILGIDRTVQNMVGAVDYGIYFVVFNFSFLFNIVLDFGITNFNNRNIAQNNHLLQKHFSSIILLKLLLSLAYFVIIFAIALILGYAGKQLHFLIFLGFNQFLISMILYLRSNISGLMLFKTDSFLSVLDRLIMILICSVLLWGHVTQSAFRIEWFVYIQTFSYLLTSIVAFLIVLRKASFQKFNWNRPFFILIIKQSFPFAILVLLMTFYNRLDSVMIERLIQGTEGERQAGVYASAFRLLDATNMIAYLFAVLLLPIFSKMLKARESIHHMVKLSSTMLITISVIVASGSFFYSYELMNALYNDHVQESAGVFRFLMGGFIPISLTYVFGTLLTANGNLKQLNLMAAGGMLINFLLNLIFIPKYQALGSAYASLITQFTTAFLQLFIAYRIFNLRISLIHFSRIVIYVISVVILCLLSKHYVPNWITGFSLMVVFSLILAFTLRLVNLGGIKDIIRKEQ